eukprot:GHVN01098605.1.p1 GENE.GHVN01098605.1~~GHVN01098605.1.p1  ORF type:complete len:264 (+),score=54.00 GHVN01098605.1:164-955(+)
MAETATATQTDVASLSKRLIAESLEVQEIVNILTQLKSVEISRELLKSTGVGRTVGGLTHHSDPTVKDLSSELVERWRKAVAASKPAQLPVAKRKEATSQRSAATASSNTEGTSSKQRSTSPPSTSEGTDESFVYISRREMETEDEKREKTRELLFNAFKGGCESTALTDAAKLSSLMDDIEEALFEHHGHQLRDTRGYWDQVRCLKANFRDTRNTRFNLRVYNGEVTATQLATMTSQQMASEEKKRERETQMKVSEISSVRD